MCAALIARVHGRGLVSAPPQPIERCQPTNVNDIESCRASATKRIVIAAACHSKDTGGFAVTNNEMYMDVAQLRLWHLDTARMRLIVGPGVMYMDVALDLAAAGMALPAYGNYGGQTIVGAMSTSTHGAGVPSLANFVKRMLIIDGRGRRRNITEADHDFAAWRNSLGALGVIAEAEFMLTQNWHVLETTQFNLNKSSIAAFLKTSPLSYAFYAPASAAGGGAAQRQRPTDPPCRACFFAWHRVQTTLRVNATYPKDNYARGAARMGGGTSISRVYAFNDMVHWFVRKTRQRAPPLACYDRVSKQAAWIGPVGHLRSELELMIRPEQLETAMSALEPARYGSSSKSIVVEFRYVLRDSQDVLLSPYRDGDRIAMSIPGVSREDGAHVVQLLMSANVDVRFHRGKGAPRELVMASTWDIGAARAFRDAKQANDPAALFGSAYLDLLPFCKPYTVEPRKRIALDSNASVLMVADSRRANSALSLPFAIAPTAPLPGDGRGDVSAMPLLAFGPQSHKPDFVSRAFQLGFRHVDTSYHYSEGTSQRNIGAGVLRFGVRAEVFITTKINGCGCTGGGRRYHGIRAETCSQDTTRAVRTSLKELKTSYVDMLLLHHPPTCRQGGAAAGHAVDCTLERTCALVQAQWTALEQMHLEGKARHIGVSNYCPRCVECLRQTAKVQPAVAQLMVNLGAFTPIKTLVAWSSRHGMRVMAYSPINGLGLSSNQRDAVARIGVAHGNRSFVQVALRWLTQHGITPIVSSRNLDHLRQNLEIFSWRLSDTAMAQLDALRGESSVRGPSQDCAWDEGLSSVPGRRLKQRHTASSSTSRRLQTYDKYSLHGMSVLDYIRETSAATTSLPGNLSGFSALEIGIGEGRALLELQQLVPNGAIVGINKPMPSFQWKSSVVQNTDDLRRSADLYHIDVTSGRIPEILLSNATDKILAARPTGSMRLVLSQHVYHYFTHEEREHVFGEIRRILDGDMGLGYVAWPAAGTLCESTFGDLQLREGQALMLGCERDHFRPWEFDLVHEKANDERKLTPYMQCFYVQRMIGVNSLAASNMNCVKRHIKKWSCRNRKYHMVVSVQVNGEGMVQRLQRAADAVPQVTDASALRSMVKCLLNVAGAPS